MAFNSDCIRRVATKAAVSEAEADDILQRVFNRGEKYRASGKQNPYAIAAAELGEQITTAAKQDKLDAIRNASVRNKLLQDVKDGGGIATADRTVRSMLHWVPDRPSIDNVSTKWRSYASAWTTARDWKLKEANAEKAAISGAMDRDVAREMWSLNAGEKTGPTGNSTARAIAEANVHAADYVAQRLRDAGVPIGNAFDYVAHTTHNDDLMRKAAGSYNAPIDDAFRAWWQFEEPLWSDKTFDDLIPEKGETTEQAKTRFARSIYDALVTGVHKSFRGGALDEGGFVPRAFEGTSNLARKLSQARVIYWKDADSWLAHMQKFGGVGSVSHGVTNTLEQGARHLALIEKFGTNPVGNFNQILRRIQEDYRDDADGVRNFQGKIDGLRVVMAHIDGSANRPGNRMWANLMRSMRTYESISDLGGVGITHFASIWPTVPTEMAQHGLSRLGTMGRMINALIKGKGSVERQEVLAQLGAYANGLTRDMYARWQADEGGVPGYLSNLANSFMKWTTIRYIFDNTQAAGREMLSNNLARNVGNTFEQLDPHLSQILSRYGLGKNEWELLRNAKNLPTVDGLTYLTPRNALTLDDGQVASTLGKAGALKPNSTADEIADAVSRYKQTLADRLYGYYGDAADRAVVTPTVRERALVLQNSKPGTLWGEIARSMMQFKMWPLAAHDQVLRRDIYRSLSKRDAAWNIGTMLALTTVGGYIGLAVKNAATGNPIPDPFDMTRDTDKEGNPVGLPHGVTTLLQSLAHGGGIGIVGDMLMGELSRSKDTSGILATAAGPIVSDADKAAGILWDYVHGKAAWPDIARFGVKHVPFANLIYIRGALDYMLWYHLYEAADPGWWERTNRRLIRDGQQPMMGYAPGQPIPWTPWGIGAKK